MKNQPFNVIEGVIILVAVLTFIIIASSCGLAVGFSTVWLLILLVALGIYDLIPKKSGNTFWQTVASFWKSDDSLSLKLKRTIAIIMIPVAISGLVASFLITIVLPNKITVYNDGSYDRKYCFFRAKHDDKIISMDFGQALMINLGDHILEYTEVKYKDHWGPFEYGQETLFTIEKGQYRVGRRPEYIMREAPDYIKTERATKTVYELR
ncbi:MAG: hypothetical protein NC098_03420 [Lachnoclostridium sp.]|nr:hypothetical protein [Lachnoclostridium sp.]